MTQVACKNEGHPQGHIGGVVAGAGMELLGQMPHGSPGLPGLEAALLWGNFTQDNEQFLRLRPGGLP